MTAVSSRFGSGSALLVCALAAVAVTASYAPVPSAARAAAVLAFALVAPGAAVSALLGIRETAPWLMVTLTASITIGVLTSEGAALASWWAPKTMLVLLAAASCLGALLAWRSDRPRPAVST